MGWYKLSIVRIGPCINGLNQTNENDDDDDDDLRMDLEYKNHISDIFFLLA